MARHSKIIEAKVCGDCKVLKALTDFYIRKDRGVPKSMCKPCDHKRSAASNKARYRRDPEFRKMQIRKMAKWRNENRERYNERMKEVQRSWRSRNKSKRMDSDAWTRHVLVQRTSLNRHDFPQSMVEAKREQLKIKRKLKELKA